MNGGICLIAGLLSVQLGDEITLRWTHSIQKTVWEEDYRLNDTGLELTEARVRGTGAGMEPPDGAVFTEGAWYYKPSLPLLPVIILRHSPYVAPYILCSREQCKTVVEWLPGLQENVLMELTPCTPQQ